MQYVFGGSLHKNSTSYLRLRLYHTSLNWISIVLMQLTEIIPQNELYYGIDENNEYFLEVFSCLQNPGFIRLVLAILAYSDCPKIFF